MQMNITWGDATGHYALWNGTAFRRDEDNYFDPTKIGSGIYRNAVLYHSMEIVFLRKDVSGGVCTFVFQFRRRRA